MNITQILKDHGLGGVKIKLTGDITAGDVLSGKKGYSTDPKTQIVGTMPDKRTTGIDTNRTEGIVELKYPDPTFGDNAFLRFKADKNGYIDENTIIRTLINNLSPANIKAGAKIGKYPLNEAGTYIQGTFTSDGDAVATDIVSGKKAYVNGALVTGTVVKKTAAANYNAVDTYAAGAGQLLIKPENALYNPLGTSSTPGTIGGWLSITDTDFASANIKAGINIFGVAGNSNVVDTSPGTAVTGDIRSGKIAFVDGVQLTGTIADLAATNYTPGTTNQTIAAGKYIAGTQTIYGDADLIAANIKNTVSIFGVTGTLQPKLYAKVTVTATTPAMSFTIYSGGTVSLPYVTVTGLSFQPRLIFIIDIANRRVTVYNEELMASGYANSKIFVDNGGSGTYILNLVANASVSATGFVMPVSQPVSQICYIYG